MSQAFSFRRTAMASIFWSLLSSWGGRAIGFVIFISLARLLTPAEFGIASSAYLVMTLLAMLAEFGFGDALVQRGKLESRQVNLPFYGSMLAAVLFAAGGMLMSGHIAAWMGVDGLAPYLVATAALCPFLTMTGFQDAMYRRIFKFRTLALRTLGSAVAGGVVGIALAYLGFGTWALIAQFVTQTVVAVLWLWIRPVWMPGTELDWSAGRDLTRFGLHVTGTRIVDFATVRSIDFIILLVYGPAALGLFSVSSRLYQLMLQLLQAGLNGVGLTMLSRVADDLPRMQRLYQRSTSLCAMFGTPVFFGAAALSHEVNLIMFGTQWAGAEKLMTPLLLIGGIHCVQYVNGSYLAALGKPDVLLRLVFLKALLILPPLYLIRMNDVAGTTMLYTATLLLVTPFTFGTTLRALSLPWRSLVRPVLVPVGCGLLAFAGTQFARHSGPQIDSLYLGVLFYGAVFCAIYGAAMACVAFSLVRDNIVFIAGAVRPGTR